MRLRQPAAPAEEPAPPATFVLDDWRDPADPVRQFMDAAWMRALRRWLDAKLAHNLNRRKS